MGDERFLGRQPIMTSLGLLIRRAAFMWLTWWLLVVFAGAGVMDAIAMGVLLALQGVVGCAALAYAGLGSSMRFVRFIGLGTAVGAAVTTLSFQLLLLYFDGVQPLIFVAALAVAGAIVLARTENSSSASRHSVLEAGTVALVALVSLGLTTGWHLLHAVVLGASLAALSLLLRRSTHPSTQSALLVVFGPVIAASWWFRASVDFSLLSRILWDGDNSIFQLLINTTERWGVLENVGASGQSPIIGYHWATFAWMGMLESASNAAPWITLQFVMPLVATLVVTAMLWEVASLVTRSVGASLFGVVIAMGLFFRPDGSVSLFLADAWLIAFSLVVHHAVKSNKFARSLPLVAFLSAGVLFGKRSTGVLLIAALLAAFAFALLLRDRRMIKRFGLLFATTIFVLVGDQSISYISQRLAGIGANDLTSGAGRVRLEFISDEAFGYAGTFSGVLSILGALFVTMTIFFPQIAALLKKLLDSGIKNDVFVGILGAVAVSAAVPFVMTGEVLAVYFYSRHLGLVLGSILVLVLVVRAFSSVGVFDTTRTRAQVLAASVLAGMAWLALFEILGRTTTIDWAIVREAAWIPALAMAMVLAVVFSDLRTARGVLTASLVGAVVISGVLATPKTFDELSNERLKPLINGSFEYADLDLPTADVNEVGAWLRENTSRDAVIGSNHFCESRQNFNLDCSPASWWTDWLSRAREIDAFGSACQVETSEVLGRVQNYLLPAVSDRRFFIQGPGFSLGCSQPPNWITERIEISESFARKPSVDSCSKLLNAGVDYFVVDRRTTDRELWDGFATERMANKSFRVLEINEGFCREA